MVEFLQSYGILIVVGLLFLVVLLRRGWEWVAAWAATSMTAVRIPQKRLERIGAGTVTGVIRKI